MSERWKTRKSLILRARNANDAQAWEDFVRYYDRFIGFVLKRMNVASSEQDDLIQNILLKLWRSLSSYDPDKGKFRSWLGVVVRNAVYDQFAETRRRRELLAQEQACFQMLQREPASAIEQMVEHEWASYVTSLALERIEKLFSVEAVQCFTMSLEDKPASEIATELNLAKDSVYTLKSRVKARFIMEIKALMEELEG